MRLFQSVIVLLITLAGTACSVATAPNPNRAALPCEVAAAYADIVIAEAKSRPVVFTASDEPFTSPIAGGEWWKMDRERPTSVTAPSAALVKRLEDQGNRNAVARCSSVRKLLDSRRIGYGSKAVDAVNSPDPAELFKAIIHNISVPVVSADGKKAILVSSGVSGPLAGGGFLQLLEKQPDGKWEVIAFSPLWVS